MTIMASSQEDENYSLFAGYIVIWGGAAVNPEKYLLRYFLFYRILLRSFLYQEKSKHVILIIVRYVILGTGEFG